MIELKKEETHLPKALILLEDEIYKIQIQIEYNILEGVFMASTNPQKIQIFFDNEESGSVYFGTSHK